MPGVRRWESFKMSLWLGRSLIPFPPPTNIALRATEITEAWTEQGQDYITVRLEANLLDYTVDEKNGMVVTGNKSEPVEFAEYWTFARSVGPNPWRLTAIQQP